MVVSDNGSELTSNAILTWADHSRVEWHYIAPASPCRTPSSSFKSDQSDEELHPFGVRRFLKRPITLSGPGVQWPWRVGRVDNASFRPKSQATWREPGAGGTDGAAHGVGLVRAEIVHDDDVAVPQVGTRTFSM
jgi:putative transposase